MANLVPIAKRYLRYRLVAPIVICAFCLAVAGTPPAQRFEFFLLDRMSELRHLLEPRRADSRLLFVGIDDATQQKFGRWPFARVFHGEFLAFLSAVNPAVVVWDILFSEPDSVNDDAFIEGIQMLKAPVITAAARSRLAGETEGSIPNPGLTSPLTRVEGELAPSAESALVPVEPIRAVSRFGFTDSTPEIDGVRRRVPLVVKIGDEVFPNLPLESLMQYWNLTPDQVRVVLGDAVYLEAPNVRRRIPIDLAGSYRINYRYDIKDVSSISYSVLHEALAAHYNEQPVNLPPLDGRIVFVALTSTGSSEIGPSPLNSRSIIPLVHINTLDNILHEDYLSLARRSWIWLVWLVIAFASLHLFEGMSEWRTLLVLTILYTVAAGAVYLAFARANLWIPAGYPLLGLMALHAGGGVRRVLSEQLAKQQIRKAFCSYLSPAVINEVLKNPDELKLGGTHKPVTILFSDIRGFTTLSESSPEEEFIDQLDEYFTEMVECVNRHGGTLHKFIGDAVMAVWGDVISQGFDVDARNAVRAALDMRTALVGLNEDWKKRNWPPFKIGIGLNHGSVLVGNVGAPQRMEFTVIGDAVNVASRIEGLTKGWQTDLAVGEEVRNLLSGQFVFRTLGLFRLKGKTEALRVSAVIRELAPEEQPPESDRLYDEAFENYSEGRFENALEGFSRVLEIDPANMCAVHYAGRCRENLQTPVAEGWDAVHVMDTK